MNSQDGQDREQSPPASRHCHAMPLDNVRSKSQGRSRAGGRETEKLQLVLLLISDLHKVETFHGPPQITITSGALEEFKRGSLGLVVMDEEHADKRTSKQQGERGLKTQSSDSPLGSPGESIKLELTPGQAPMRTI